MSETPENQPPPAADTVSPLQRVLMDRARRQAEKDQQKLPRSKLQVALSVVLAFAAVLIIGGAINGFLTAMQRTMRVMDDQEKAEAAAREAERRRAPMPAYVVPEDEKKKPEAGP